MRVRSHGHSVALPLRNRLQPGQDCRALHSAGLGQHDDPDIAGPRASRATAAIAGRMVKVLVTAHDDTASGGRCHAKNISSVESLHNGSGSGGAEMVSP